MIFFGLLDLFYDYPLDFGSIIHPQFFFLYMGYFDSVLALFETFLILLDPKTLKITMFWLTNFLLPITWT